MKNVGLYFIDRSKTLNDNQWSRHALCYNDEPVCTSIEETDNNGVIIVHNKLYCNGEEIAEASIDQPCRIDENGKFGDVDLLGHTTCINITKEDYITLYSGGKVVGYKKYDPLAVYNIVEDVAEAPIRTCVKPDKGRDFLYNNIASYDEGGLSDNELTNATFTSNTTPQLSVHDVSLRLEIETKNEHKTCQPVTLMYMVDTKDNRKLHFDELDDTFTTIIKDCNGKELYRKTTYAGEFWISFDLFAKRDIAEGETYFSIECIDNHGVGSVVQFFNVGVFNKVDENLYNVDSKIGSDITATRNNETIEQLSFEYNLKSYTLYLNDSDSIHAYQNKLALSALFSKAKAAGYNGIKLYNGGGKSNPTTYYISYNKNVSGSSNSIDLGSQTYYVYNIARVVVNNSVQLQHTEQQIVSGGTITVNGTKYTVDSNESPLDFIKRDGAYLHRVPNNITSHARKIWVRWHDDGHTWSEGRKGNNAVGLGDTSNLRVYDPKNEQWAEKISNAEDYSAYKNDILRTRLTSTDLSKVSDGTYYFVDNTEEFGDPIVFPDNFTIDMNGAVFQATQTIGIKGGAIIWINNNYNTHIKNGVVSGLYKEFPFKDAFFAVGHGSGGVCESLANIKTTGSRYCSVQNVESRYSVGYDCQNFTDGVPANTHTISGKIDSNSFSFGNCGYIGLNGEESTADTIREATYLGHTDKTYYEGLVYDNAYHPWSFKFDGKAVDECYMSCLYLLSFMNGKEHEFFIHFYKKVESTYKFISTLKTAQWHVIKCPEGTTHFRVTAYGLVAKTNGEIQSVLATHFGNQINAAFYTFEFSCLGKKFTNGMLYKNNWTHHTRNTGFSCESNGVTWDSCKFEGVATIPYIDWYITKLLGATEDGSSTTNLVTIKNCTVNRLYSGVPSGPDITDTSSFKLINGTNVTVINNDGISISALSNLQDIYTQNNNFRSLNCCIASPTPHPHWIFINNNVYDKYVDSYYEAAAPVDYATTVTDVYLRYEAPAYRGIRLNNCDEPISGNISMKDCFLVKTSNNTLSLRKNNPRYKTSKVGIYVLNQQFDDPVTYYKRCYFFDYDGEYDATGNYSLNAYIPIIVGRIHNPVEMARIYIDGIAWERALKDYNPGSEIEEDLIRYINPSYIPNQNGSTHNIFCDYARVSTTHGAIQITAWKTLIVPENGYMLGNDSRNYFRQRYCFDNNNEEDKRVLVFLGKTPPYFEIGYRDTEYIHRIHQATDNSQAKLTQILVPKGCEDAYRDMLKSIDKNSVDQSFLNELVEGCDYEDLISKYNIQ